MTETDTGRPTECELAARIAELERHVTSPLAQRVNDLESHLSLEVCAARLSKTLKRTIVLSCGLACFLALGGSLVNNYEINLNRGLASQVATDNATIQRDVHTLLVNQRHNDRDILANRAYLASGHRSIGVTTMPTPGTPAR